jgi:hypothetical protein
VFVLYEEMTLNMVRRCKNGDMFFAAVGDSSTKIQSIYEPTSFYAHTCLLLSSDERETKLSIVILHEKTLRGNTIFYLTTTIFITPISHANSQPPENEIAVELFVVSQMHFRL